MTNEARLWMRAVQFIRVVLPLVILALYAYFIGTTQLGGDLWGYVTFDWSDPYAVSRVDEFGVVYSPAWLQAMSPLRLLDWSAIRVLWAAVEIAALAWLTGPWLAVGLIAGGMGPLWGEFRVLNINLLLGVAIWAGFRYPALWALPLLTKVTPGVGLIWFAVRREWRNLAIAVGVTAAIATISLLIAPNWWVDWLNSLTGNVSVARGGELVALWQRGIASVAIVTYGALRGWHWTVPLAVALAHPDAAWIVWVMMLGCVRWYLLDRSAEHRFRWFSFPGARGGASRTA